MFQEDIEVPKLDIMNDGSSENQQIENRNRKGDKNFKISNFLFDKIKRWGMIHMGSSKQMYFRGGNLGSEFIG